MSQLSAERIGEIVANALERTAFVLADPVSDMKSVALSALTNHSRILFSGALAGAVHLRASDGFVRELAASLLGIDVDEIDLETQGGDALCELANIVGGSIILELGGDELPYEYGLPELINDDEFDAASPNVQTCVMESDDELLAVSWIPSISASRNAA